jgi:uncharacterized protein (TIGR02996 family)
VIDVARDSTPEAAFHRAIFGRPADPLPVLIYADWLEEHGDPRGPYLRRFPDIYRVIARLRTIPTSHAQQYDLAGPSLQDREQFIHGLALALIAHRFDDTFNPQVPDIVTTSLDRLARFLPSIEGLEDVY